MLTDDAETMRLACIAQLYDDWHGGYVLRHLSAGFYWYQYDKFKVEPIDF